MSRGSRTPLAGAALALGLALLVVGCAPANESGFRDSVEHAAQQVAAGDVAGALATIDALEADVSASSMGGTLPAGETDRIQAAIDAVRADLVAMVPPSPMPGPSSQPSDLTDDAATSTDQEDSAGSDTGKGKGKGKGRPDD